MREIRIPKKPRRYVELPDHEWEQLSFEEMERDSRRRDAWSEWVVAMNTAARELAKAGQVEEAVEIYEEAIAARVDTPGTYRGLLAIYRRLKNREGQIATCGAALKNLQVEYRPEFESELRALVSGH